MRHESRIYSGHLSTPVSATCATMDPANERVALDFLERVDGAEIVRG
jgi:hypothetical protein